MASKSIIAASAAILVALLYQVVLKYLIFVTFGLGRTHQHIEDFPYTCRRIHHKLLESCEDLWLDHEGRTLYAACADPAGRMNWAPGGNRYNASARSMTDHVAVLNIDEPGSDGLYGLHQLEVTGDYISADGGKNLDLHGFDVEVLADSRLRFWMINHRPPIDVSGKPLDPKKYGANSTIEVFDLERGSSQWEFVKTIASEAVATPNDVAATGNGGLVISNDHNSKVGFFRNFEMLVGAGNVAYCGSNNECHIAAANGFNFANGVVRGKDGLYYVSSTVRGKISVHSLQPDLSLVKVDELSLGMPIDNLSVDADGDIFAAAFPKVIPLAMAMDAPYTTVVPSTIFRIRKSTNEQGDSQYQVSKALEDIDGKVLPGTTSATHDAKTGRFFLSGVASPFITVCETRA